MTTPPPTERTRIRREAHRAHYDRATIEAILDDSLACHVAFTDDAGVHCIPTACWRTGGHLYLHGSNGSRMLKALQQGDCCITVTHLDGLVLARSAFNHSINYRSVVVYGRCETVEGEAKAAALDAFLERLAPGRSREARPGDRNELASTTVLRIALTEAAAKVREGGPNDDADDLQRPVWAGVLPWERRELAPVRASDPALPEPDYVRRWGAGR